MPFKIAQDYANPNSYVPGDPDLKAYIAWLRRELATAVAELDARVNPKSASVAVTTTSGTSPAAWQASWDGKGVSLKPLPKLPAKKPAKKKAGAK